MILGIILKLIYQFWQLEDAFRWKFEFNYKTHDFNNFIKEQNADVYKALNIEVIAEREGLWLEFLLREEEQMFEELIADRREKIFNKPNNQKEIDEMKQILNDYSKDKAEAEARAQN